ncbi:fatty acyl-CoA reductase [Pelomonas cellulosilytica]|uniref:Fatty acyl-CoA reductase n=1 Tax=Pelomonas cellulosilytica TaxID=2906762 RepID=A0ABS8XUC5_9BURK|nr:fatty acyl-CoA reductase [Pelomonas sp. P8]MCE4554309.1 fatty acyl-CoA reductase [Pelomonas sp. P8]
MSVKSFPPRARAVLLTGATGFLGKVVLADLVRHREVLGLSAIYVLIRPKKGRTAAERFNEQLLTSEAFREFEPGWHRDVVAVPGDVARPLLGLEADMLARLKRELTHIVHCAASVDFNLPLKEALQANVRSTLEVQSLAEQCQSLPHLLSVSTAYVQPHREGVLQQTLQPLPEGTGGAEALLAAIDAGQLDEAQALALCGHPNTYTFTKCLAEHLLLARRARVPVTLLRPSIISVAQQFPHPGWIDSSAALAGFVLCLAAGYLRVVSGDRRAQLDVVPVDQVASMIRQHAFDVAPEAGSAIVHAVAGRPRNLPLDRFAELAVEYFKRHPQQRSVQLKAFDRHTRWRELQHWWYHLLPLRLAGRWARLTRNPIVGRQAARLEKVLESVFRSFQYFTHRTYQFELSPHAAFDMPRDQYIRLVCEGTRRHLLHKLQPQAARSAPGGVPAHRVANSVSSSDDASR